jgi:hypothetical protein
VLWPSDVVSQSGPLISSVICSVIFSVFFLLCLFSVSLLCVSVAEHSRAVAYCRQLASTVTLGIKPRWDPWPYICSVSRLFFFFFRCSSFDKKGGVGLFYNWCSLTTTYALRDIGGHEKGSLESERARYGHESHRTGTREWLRWQRPAAILKDWPVLSSEKAPYINKPVFVW